MVSQLHSFGTLHLKQYYLYLFLNFIFYFGFKINLLFLLNLLLVIEVISINFLFFAFLFLMLYFQVFEQVILVYHLEIFLIQLLLIFYSLKQCQYHLNLQVNYFINYYYLGLILFIVLISPILNFHELILKELFNLDHCLYYFLLLHFFLLQ